jgi:hypothetical protein
MTGELERLWELHGLDEQVSACHATLSRFEEERAQLRSRLDGERARVEAVQKRIAEVQLRRRQLEKEVETAAGEERKFQNQLLSVKKNEEYQALLHEIDAVRRRRSDAETRVLEAMEEEDAATREKPVAQAALAAGEREVAERVAGVDREEAARRAELEGLEQRRRQALDGLTPQVRARYERIHASRDGRAVVPIRGGACGGCFRGQPPQLLQEARRGDRVLTCEGCGRMLVLPPE